MNRLWVLFVLIVLVVGGLPVSAQGGEDDTCADAVADALAAAADACAEVPRGSACLGRPDVGLVVFTDNQPDFAQPGDTAPLDGIAALAADSYDVDSGAWGLAVLHLPANVPESQSGPALMLLLLGEAALESAPPPVDPDVEVVTLPALTGTDAVLYSGPDRAAAVITSLPEDLPLILIGVDATGRWIEVAQGLGSAWIERESVVVVEDDIDALSVTFGPGIPPRYGPMQALRLIGGAESEACPAAFSGLAMAAPTCQQHPVRLNGVDVRLQGRAVALLLPPDADHEFGALVLALIDGLVQVVGEDGIDAITLETPGAVIALPLDEDGDVVAAAVPFDPRPALAASGRDPRGGALCDLLAAHPLFGEPLAEGVCAVDLVFPAGEG